MKVIERAGRFSAQDYKYAMSDDINFRSVT
jgi:hypothetical protein